MQPPPRLSRVVVVLGTAFFAIWMSVAALLVFTFVEIADDASACARPAPPAAPAPRATPDPRCAPVGTPSSWGTGTRFPADPTDLDRTRRRSSPGSGGGSLDFSGPTRSRR